MQLLTKLKFIVNYKNAVITLFGCISDDCRGAKVCAAGGECAEPHTTAGVPAVDCRNPVCTCANHRDPQTRVAS